MAAVRSGADAVYLGLRDFNARRNADNFGSLELRSAVEYCHVRGVRVYLTLNTLLRDDELPRALSAAAKAYKIGVDAVIVQDLGLAKLLHTRLPRLPLHASTQLTAHSPAALPFLKELGFTKVVISREMNREEIKEFCLEADKLGITVEAFVHGALCMSMSGQCYLSALLGGRSGNRGLCAGPCRLPFTATENGRYDLSLKDLSLVDHIEELKSLGVRSLKIEGRMKRPEYVAAATAVCKAAAEGRDYAALYDTLSKVFSRSGFTDGYFENRLGADMFGVRTKEDVLMSASVLKSLHELYRSERQSVTVSGKFVAKTDEPIKLTINDGEREVTAEGVVPEAAINRPLTDETALSQLKKTGGTPFIFERLETEIEDGLSVGAGALNALRREALEKLTHARYTENETVDTGEIPSKKTDNKQRKLYARFSSISQIPNNLEGIEKIIIPLEEEFENFNSPLPLCLDIPRGIKDEKYILSRLIKAKELGIREAYCGNIAAVTLCLTAGISPCFDFSMNIFNSQSALAAKELGATSITLSFELSTGGINSLYSPIPVGIIAYGRVPLMLTRNCPLKNTRTCATCDKQGELTDRMGVSFPVRCRGGYSELLNSRPIYLAERQDEFNVDYMTLYFTTEEKSECEEIIKKYRNCEKARGEYTRGLYYRAVE